MTANLPVLDSTMHVAGVMYACTFGLTTASSGLVTFQVPAPVQFAFTFDTGRTQPDPAVSVYDVTTDTSWFNQAATETAIKSALDTICTQIAAMLGVTQAAVQATVTVKRAWRVAANQEGDAAAVQVPPFIYSEAMAYP